MIVKHRFIIQHRSGYFINAKYEPVKQFESAFRFPSREDAIHFFTESYYKSDKPEEYRVRTIKIIEELEAETDGCTGSDEETPGTLSA